MKRLLILAAILFITACSSTTKVTQPITAPANLNGFYSEIDIEYRNIFAPDYFASILEHNLQQKLEQNALFRKGEGNHIKVNVFGYNMRSSMSRGLFGVLAGTDRIDSEIIVLDSEGNEIGRSVVTTTNKLVVGHMNDLARMHAEEIARFLGVKKA
ncbi:hypothetical protein ACWJJH_21635 [Endozoicomonadaceae bacterium StTr2]